MSPKHRLNDIAPDELDRMVSELKDTVVQETSCFIPSLSSVQRSAILSSTEKIADHTEQIEEEVKALKSDLKEEAKSRAKEDRKYFWLGALISLATAMLVEHGCTLIALLLRVFQR